jgi:hypothetical protein
MVAVDADCGGQPFVDEALCGARVWILERQIFDFEDRVLLEVFPDLMGSMVRRFVDEQDHLSEATFLAYATT